MNSVNVIRIIFLKKLGTDLSLSSLSVVLLCETLCTVSSFLFWTGRLLNVAATIIAVQSTFTHGIIKMLSNFRLEVYTEGHF